MTEFYPNDPGSPDRRDEVPSEAGGWLLFTAALVVILGVTFGLGQWYGPHDQATIASNMRADGTVTGNGNTPPGETTGAAVAR
ncbi:MAG: hypothetical protein JO205_08260 [Pseudolabrys sp.]|nr:hypothetical protein [Pseudolabrys sp.]